MISAQLIELLAVSYMRRIDDVIRALGVNRERVDRVKIDVARWRTLAAQASSNPVNTVQKSPRLFPRVHDNQAKVGVRFHIAVRGNCQIGQRSNLTADSRREQQQEVE